MPAISRLPSVDAVVDGVRLHVVDYGGTDQPDAIVLLSGPFTGANLWTDVTRDLAHAHRVLIPDLVGLGDSEAPIDRRTYSPAAQAQRVLMLLDDWRIERFTAVGHGLGGAIAVHLGALAPSRIRGLVLASAPLHRDVWPTAAGLPSLPTGLRALRDRRIEPDRTSGRRKFLRAMDMPSVENAASLTVGIPSLVLWGDHDEALSPAYGRRVAACLRAEWVPVTGAGHLLPSERPERVAEELHAFVSGLATPLP